MSYSQKAHKTFMKSHYLQTLVTLLTTSHHLLVLLVTTILLTNDYILNTVLGVL